MLPGGKRKIDLSNAIVFTKDIGFDGWRYHGLFMVRGPSVHLTNC